MIEDMELDLLKVLEHEGLFDLKYHRLLEVWLKEAYKYLFLPFEVEDYLALVEEDTLEDFDKVVEAYKY